MWKLKTDINESICKTNKLTDKENSVMVTKGEREGEEGYIRNKGLAK